MMSLSFNSVTSFDSSLDQKLDEDHCSRPTLSYFEEADSCFEIIESTLSKEITSAYDYEVLIQSYDPAIRMLNKYMSQPQLLDPHLPRILQPLFSYIRTHLFNVEQWESKGAVFYVIYHIALVRRPKLILKYFPHEANEVEPLLQLLTHPDLQSMNYWHARYVLLLWISYLMMLPFSIRILIKSTEYQTVVERILSISKPYLSSPGKERDAAACLIGRLLSRVDVITDYLPKFLTWVNSESPGSLNAFKLIGRLQALCNILKYSERKLILSFIPLFLPILDWFEFPSVKKNNVLRKLIMKYTQRLGTILLKQKPPSWRYQRGSRSLELNLSIQKEGGASPFTTFKEKLQSPLDEKEEEEEINIPEEIEMFVNVLFTGLRDKDTIVRWSAAKGFGRIAFRLPKEMAEEILLSIFEQLKETTMIDSKERTVLSACEATWHGACLTIAEFTRRGILLPSHLPSVMDWIELGLTFDLRKGTTSVGSNVRDAACFVCWSIARGYAPEVVQPYAHRLAPLLVSVAVFDREVNVRRAASAAFQENVGRQSVFPHGIEIVTMTDFFIIGTRSTSFLEAAPQVAKFTEYRSCMLSFLLHRSLKHWDESIRVLASKVCQRLIDIEPCRFIDVFNTLKSRLLDSDLPTRHGAALGLAESLLSASTFLSFSHLETLWSTIQSIPDSYLHSFGSEITRNGVCRLIECYSSVAKRNSLPRTWVHDFFGFLETSWERKEENLQRDAAQAAQLLLHHLSMEDAEELIQRWCELLCQLSTPLFTKIGLVYLLGMIPSIFFGSLNKAIETLIQIMDLPPMHSDANLRKNVMISLGRLVRPYFTFDTISSVLLCLQKGLDDYSTSAQGDIGSWVRMAAMEALLQIGSQVEWSQWGSISLSLFFKCLVQLLSRIDKVRSVAQKCVKGLLPFFKHVPDHAILNDIFFTSTEEWSHSLIAFQSLVPLLNFDTYRDSVLLGFVLCMGANSASTEREVIQVLSKFFEKHVQNVPFLMKIVTSLYNIYELHVRQIDRNFVSFFNALHSIYCIQILPLDASDVHQTFFDIVLSELQSQSSVSKQLLLLKLCGIFCSIPTTCNQAVSLLLSYLIKDIPRLRKAAAEYLFMFLPLYFVRFDEHPLILEEKEKALTSFYTLLNETDWIFSNLEILDSIHGQLYKLLQETLGFH